MSHATHILAAIEPWDIPTIGGGAAGRPLNPYPG